MEKTKLTIKPNKNLVLSILLLAGIVWSVFQIFSAPPDPGHGWADIGDSPNDALPVNRGGTGQTSLTAENVLLGNTTGAVKFVAPGTAGNVLQSNGTTWASSNLAGLVALIYSDDTPNAENTTSTSEQTLKYWVMNIYPGIYKYYILEAEVMGNQGHNANATVTFTWNLNEGANSKKSITWKAVGSTLAGLCLGVKLASTISATSSNSLPINANLIVNGMMSASNAAVTMAAYSFRVYGVK